jgi:DNA mismatch repair protein MutS
LKESSSEISLDSLTPVLRQYMETKELSPDSFLFFQVGDFFELFFDDAVEVSKLLGLTLTSRQKIDKVPVPMCGVPLAACDSYVNRLAAMGHKVSVCEQESQSAPGEKIAKRRLVKIVTPGTILSSDDDEPGGRFLALSSFQAPSDPAPKTKTPQPLWYLASVDLSTGDFSLSRGETEEDFSSELIRLDPKEILSLGAPPGHLLERAEKSGIFLSNAEAAEDAEGLLFQVFGTRLKETLPELFLDSGAVSAIAALVGHLKTLAPGTSLNHLSLPRLLWDSPHLGLDETAIRNLELTASLRDGSSSGTLLGILDQAVTPMGSRLIKSWLIRPLRDFSLIEKRHEAVSELITQSLARDSITALLKETRDLERSMARLSLSRASIRDLFAIRSGLRLLPTLRGLLADFSAELLQKIAGNLYPREDLSDTLERSLSEQSDFPPGTPEGSFIPAGLSPRLDEYRELESGGRKKIAEIEASEKMKTRISGLKVGYTRVFGYYLEVPKNQLKNVPENWQRRQTLSTSERFVTEELLSWEERILSAGEKRAALEERILDNLKKRVTKHTHYVKTLAFALSELDALRSLATVSQRNSWIRPRLTENEAIEIKGGRHPVVEAFLPKGENFVENDININQKDRILIITGPNMSGKSTILRQTALIVILNQMGSFVPAREARLSIRDHVFTRVGASDELSRGRSTFMVEMIETAKILHKATFKSLVILDEVGRGTSTFDGLAIAWAIAEYLHDRDGRGVPTLFATHYHELIDLADSKPLAVNYNVSVKKWEGKVVFLRKLLPGGTSKSYGIAVAALAGLPRKVIRRAGEVLADLTEGSKKNIRPQIRPAGLFPELSPQTHPKITETPAFAQKTDPAYKLIGEIARLQPESLTPLEGLTLLNDLRDRAKELLS